MRGLLENATWQVKQGECDYAKTVNAFLVCYNILQCQFINDKSMYGLLDMEIDT